MSIKIILYVFILLEILVLLVDTIIGKMHEQIVHILFGWLLILVGTESD